MGLIFLLLLLLCKALLVMTTGPPLIDVGSEVVFQVGTGVLLLNCEGSRPLQWTKKDTFPEFEDFVSYSTQNDTYVTTVRIESPFSFDSGYYYCNYTDTADSKKADGESVAAVYVFVTGESTFVHQHLTPVHVNVGETLKIECITAVPNISVSLSKNEVDITNDARVKIDNKEGVTMQNVTPNDAGRYACIAENGDTVTTAVKVIGEDKKPRPSIDKGKNQYFVEGESFYLICSVVDLVNAPITWIWPNKKADHKPENESERRNSTVYQKSILHVKNASMGDTGNYTCIVTLPDNAPSRVTAFIQVKENQASFVSINGSEKIQPFKGELNVTWKVDVRFYPANPTIKYTNWRDEELHETDRISFDHDEHEGYLRLKFASIRSSDFGNYTITIMTADSAARDSSTVLIEVQSAPNMTLKEVPSFMVEGESQNATCLAQGFPKPSINMLLQTCSSRCLDCEVFSSIQAEKNETRHPAPGNFVERSITFSANTSGFLFCSGENVNGFSNTSQAIRISDIGGIFVLRHTGQDDRITREEDHMHPTIIENDEFSLMCAGSKFEYDKVTLHGGECKIFIPGACHPGKHSVPFPGPLLNICELDERGVQFDEDSNMNNQTVVVGDESFTLNCTVTGSPRPTITWKKDNKNLITDSEFFDHKAMQFLSESQVLKFDYVLKKHEGEYTCVAENRINKSVSSLTLTVPGTSTGVMVGLITAFVGIAILGIVIVFLINRVRQERKTLNEFIALEKELLQQMGNIELLNPNRRTDEQAELLPCNIPKWEVPRSNITIGKQLGAGTFGRVVKASVTGLEGPACTTVAIKMCKNAFDVSQARALALELKIMMNLGKHLNIVNLMGASTAEIRKGELWIMVEYCRFGNLINFMQRHRRKFTNLICPETGKIQHHLVANPPMSPCFSESYPPAPAIDQEGYLCPSTSKLVLSDPPPGRSTGTDPSSNVLAPGNSRNRAVANNPLYTMGVGVIMEEPEDIGNFRDIKNLQFKGNRILSIGSNTLADDSSSRPLNTQNDIMTADTQQTSCHSPLSPTESYFEKSFDYMDEIGSVPGVNAAFSTVDLVSWAWQVAHGMEYLCRRKILHGDLAARNILLADNNRVKISDFGLSRNIKNDQYIKDGNDLLLPVMWMSVEAIRDRIFSIQSDVWAFGITLWEIFSLGNTPYPGMNYKDFLAMLENGHRMACPEYANEEM
ncbi:Vascular endothelial growth factor receptor 1 [Chionoecetes opilio]|uniref:Vascular endothelial growth factor receptor 1 n=1 Tax=Chionoecetes opilio TaxID=41210 RepID=A0A8J4XT33_CHIOP|nr:Vascular endothelial growth factor receptor 1 [Chionoecetes opilio]